MVSEIELSLSSGEEVFGTAFFAKLKIQRMPHVF